MFEWIKSKITWMQYNAIVTALLGILGALTQFGVIPDETEMVKVIAAAVWMILVAIGIGIQASDSKKVENNSPKITVFKRKNR